MILSPVETRILGCLLEKERTTPDVYPLSLNSLAVACNQTTNREPVVAYDENAVEQGLASLREKKLATVIFGAGSRVQKYRHTLLETYNLDRREVALLCVLLLRGTQTPGELRTRTERLCGVLTLEETEACLENLTRGEHPLVRAIPARLGQKEKRYVQLLSGEPDLAEPPSAAHIEGPIGKSRIEKLEEEVASLRGELQNLREEFAAFRKQFE